MGKQLQPQSDRSGVHPLHGLPVPLQHDVSPDLERGPQLATVHGEVRREDEKLLHPLSVGRGSGVHAVEAELSGKRERFMTRVT